MKSLLGDRSNSALEVSSPAQPSFISAPRMSILPSMRMPLLRRPENQDVPQHSKTPLLTMKLSSFSFLNSTVTDAVSEVALYTIKTTDTSTTLTRNDCKHGSVKTAQIKWPRVLSTKPSGKDATEGVLVQLRDSRWNAGDSLLKPAVNPNSMRKFKIPGYSDAMKWKRYGDVYWCTTASVKGPIAVMEMGGRSQLTQITLYETLHDKKDPKALSAIQGVSILLLDHILVTALLMVTDLQDWMLVKKFQEPNTSSTSASGQASNSGHSGHDVSLRKIMYGEPIFPKLSLPASESRSKHSSSSTAPMTPGPPQTPTSARFGTSVYSYAESFYTSSRPSSPKPGLPSIAGSHDDLNSCEPFSIPEIRSASPLPESLHFSSRRPSLSHFDPSFYGSSAKPPVPPLPAQYATTSSRIGSNLLSSTPLAQTFTQDVLDISADANSEKPAPPPASEEVPVDGHISPQSTGMVRSERSNSVRSYKSTTSQYASSSRRPLPKPPQAPLIAPSPLAPRRVQSSAQLRSNATLSPTPSSSSSSPAQGTQPPFRPQRSLPPTPSTAVMNDVASTCATSSSSAVPPTPLLPPPSIPSENAHSRNPPITKASQEDLTNWVHMLTTPQRDLPPAPLPSTSIYDVPPPAYDTINFSRSKPHRGRSSGRGADTSS